MGRHYLVAGALFLLYGIGWFLPESPLWGVNHLAFLPFPFDLILLVIAGLLMVPRIAKRVGAAAVRGYEQIFPVRDPILVSALAISGLSLVIFYSLRVETDMYGDTRSLLKYLSEKSFTLADLLDPRDMEPLTRLILQSLSRFLGADQKATIQIVSVVAGAVYVFAIVRFAASFSPDAPDKMLALVLLLTGGANQLFFGHVEDYTLLYLAVSLLCISAWHYLEERGPLWPVIVLFFVGIRLHAEMVLYFPCIVFLSLISLSRRNTIKSESVPMKSMAYLMPVSLVVAGILYFAVFQAHVYEPAPKEVIVGKVFLPLDNRIPNFNGYELQSLDHLIDVSQILLLIVAPITFVLLIGAPGGNRGIRWSDPKLMFYGVGTLYCLLFLATVHPILSFPRDWDLFATLAVPFGFLALALLRARGGIRATGDASSVLIGFSLALGLLSSSFFVVNAFGSTAAERIRSIGVWVFRSYHGGSSYLMNVGCQSIGDVGKEVSERERLLGVLRPYRLAADKEFGFLEQKLAEAYYLNREYPRSRKAYEDALGTYPENSEALKGYAVLLLKMGFYEEGLERLDEFNDNYNDPFIQDQWTLVAAEYAHLLAFLDEAGAPQSELSEVANAFEVIVR